MSVIFCLYPETPVKLQAETFRGILLRAENLAVCEQDRCRAVLQLHHCCVIAVEILYLLPHIAVMFPRRRDRDHDSQRKIHAAHGKEFQRVGDSLPYFQFCANITFLQNCQII